MRLSVCGLALAMLFVVLSESTFAQPTYSQAHGWISPPGPTERYRNPQKYRRDAASYKAKADQQQKLNNQIWARQTAINKQRAQQQARAQQQQAYQQQQARAQQLTKGRGGFYYDEKGRLTGLLKREAPRKSTYVPPAPDNYRNYRAPVPQTHYPQTHYPQHVPNLNRGRGVSQ